MLSLHHSLRLLPQNPIKFQNPHLQKSTIYSSKLPSKPARISANHSLPSDSQYALAALAPLEAILFDIDGTLADSDPIHYYAFRQMLQEVGFNGGVPITEEFFIDNISGRDNEKLCHTLFPGQNLHISRKFMQDKEVMFRKIALEKLEPTKGLDKLIKWIEDCDLKRAAVTNAPRSNGELMISLLGLSEFFPVLVIGEECEQPKPYPDPYLNALRSLGVSYKHAFVFEDSFSGTRAGVAAGMPVVGIGRRNPEESLKEAGASFVIKDFDDPKLWEALGELEQKSEV